MSAATSAIAGSLLVVGLFLWAFSRVKPNQGAWGLAMGGLALWTGILVNIADAPLFARSDLLPPPFAGLFLALLTVGIGVGLSPVGARLADEVPIRALVAFQGFRLLAEWTLYAAYTEGIGPVQMTWLGNNKDVVTAVLALVLMLVPALDSRRWMLWLFNIVGIGNLVIIAVTAGLSMPSPFRVYTDEPSQLWVTTWPYILLPGFMVTAAVLGHTVLIRAMIRRGR